MYIIPPIGLLRTTQWSDTTVVKVLARERTSWWSVEPMKYVSDTLAICIEIAGAFVTVLGCVFDLF